MFVWASVRMFVLFSHQTNPYQIRRDGSFRYKDPPMLIPAPCLNINIADSMVLMLKGPISAFSFLFFPSSSSKKWCPASLWGFPSFISYAVLSGEIHITLTREVGRSFYECIQLLCKGHFEIDHFVFVRLSNYLEVNTPEKISDFWITATNIYSR